MEKCIFVLEHELLECFLSEWLYFSPLTDVVSDCSPNRCKHFFILCRRPHNFNTLLIFHTFALFSQCAKVICHSSVHVIWFCYTSYHRRRLEHHSSLLTSCGHPLINTDLAVLGKLIGKLTGRLHLQQNLNPHGLLPDRSLWEPFLVEVKLLCMFNDWNHGYEHFESPCGAGSSSLKPCGMRRLNHTEYGGIHKSKGL